MTANPRNGLLRKVHRGYVWEEINGCFTTGVAEAQSQGSRREMLLVA
jgi:hypothetical protein